jgi:hypothetical protein
MAMPKSVDNYLELRQIAPPPDHEYVFIAGLPDPENSGLQGFFEWRPHSLAADNDGTVLKPLALPTHSKGRWHRVFDGAISVKWFGAKGDGKTVLDGAMTAGSNQLISQSAAFAPSDVGKSISVEGAGGVQDLAAVIAQYIGTTQVALAAAASTPVSGASVSCPLCGSAATLGGGTMVAGSDVLTIQSGTFTPSDVGEIIRVADAGPPGPLLAVITSYTSPTQVTVSLVAARTVSMAKVFWATDDTDAIQAAEDAVAATGGTVLFPPGTYVINGAKATIPGDTRTYGISKKSNTKWVGSGYGSSILRLKDGSTSDPTNPQKTIDPQLIYANAPLTDIGFYRLGFDLNAANNVLFALANVAAIWFNGESLEVHGMIVEECRFFRGPGATIILIQNRATSWSGYPLDDVLICNNRFQDNCLSPTTNDHSTMNIWARRTRVIGNTFEQTDAVPCLQRYRVASAVEFHGADGLFLGNTIRSYGSVVIPSENFIEPWQNLLVANNMALDLGLYFTSTEVGTSTETKPIDKIFLRGNLVEFNNNAYSGLKAGLMQEHGKPISYIEVSDNYFEMATPTPGIWTAGVISQPISPGTSYTTHLKVAGNTFSKMEFGVLVENSSHYDQVKNLEFVNNTCLNMQDLGAAPEATGLWADGAASQHICNLVITGNRFINEADHSGYTYGIELRSYIDNLYLGADNVFYNMKSQPVWEVSPICKWRGPIIEATSVWSPGSVGAASFVSTDVPVAGAALGDLAAASFSLAIQDLLLSAAVTATNTVTVVLTNNTASAVALGQGSLFIRLTKKAF